MGRRRTARISGHVLRRHGKDGCGRDGTVSVARRVERPWVRRGRYGGVTPLGVRSGAFEASGGARAWSAHRESMFPIATPTGSATSDRVTSREPAGARAPAAESDARDEAPSPSVCDKRRNGESSTQ